jgi:CBS domain-containing protein
MTGNNAQNTLRPGEDASEALNLLSSRDVPQVQVVEDGKLLGVVRRKDILRWLKSSGRKGQ